MHTIIVGCGRVGSELARALSSSGHDVVIVDKDEGTFGRLGAGFNGITLRGSGTDEGVLKTAGIEHCDAFAAVTNSDGTNMMAAQIAGRIRRVPRVVVRLYMPDKEQTARLLGLDYVADSALTVRAIAEKIGARDVDSAGVQRDLEQIEFTAGPKMEGRTVRELQIPGEFRICMVTREGSSFIPWRDTRMRERDVVSAVVKAGARKRIEPLMRGS
jgi:trk system potassium uptake protein TrkA